MRISDTIKQLRTNSGYTQNQLAEKLNCNRQKIADWERGKSLPAADDLVLLSKTFQVSTDYLLGIAEIKTTNKDVQFVCEYTGLSDESVATLHADTFPHKDDIYRRFSSAINFLLQGEALYFFSALSDRFLDYRSYWQLMNSRTESMNNFLNGNTEKSLETYAEMENMFYSLNNTEDRRDVQKLRMQEILSDLLEYYCAEEKYREEELQDGFINFTSSMFKLETYLAKQKKDGEPHGNDQ